MRGPWADEVKFYLVRILDRIGCTGHRGIWTTNDDQIDRVLPSRSLRSFRIGATLRASHLNLNGRIARRYMSALNSSLGVVPWASGSSEDISCGTGEWYKKVPLSLRLSRASFGSNKDRGSRADRNGSSGW